MSTFNQVFIDFFKKGKKEVRERDVISAVEENGMFGRGEVKELIAKMLRESAFISDERVNMRNR